MTIGDFTLATEVAAAALGVTEDISENSAAAGAGAADKP